MSSSRSRGLLTAYSMVFATLLVTGALGYVNVRRLYNHEQLVDHTREVMAELRLLLNIVTQAESGARGYVLSGNAGYLRSYEAAMVAAPAAVAQLQRLTRDNAAQQANMEALERKVSERLDLMRKSIEIARSDGMDAGRAAIVGGPGQASMDALRELIRSMERQEQRLLTERVGEAEVSYATAVVTSIMSALIGMMLAALGLYWTSRDLQERERQNRELVESKERLEERVRERTAALSAMNTTLREEIDERERAERAARHAMEELHRSNRELAQFAAVASHDLQEPLRKIQAFGDRLLGQCRDDLNDKGRDYLDRMLASAARMRSLIDGLLEYSRVTTRKQPMVPVDLGAVARDVLGDLESRLHESGGRVEVGSLPTIAADPLQMRQLMQNLIGNALKFHRLGTPPEVCIWGHLAENKAPAGESAAPADGESHPRLTCEFTIQDNGVGFDATYADRVFELFQRLHGRDEYEGTGMGLAICKKIVERHGGTIAAMSSPGKGSRFVISLPVAHPEAGDMP